MAEKKEPKKSKPVDTKAKPPKNQKEQSARFIETARDLGVDESGEKFIQSFGKIVSRKMD